MKYWIAPIAFRLVLASVISVLLFVVVSQVFLHDSANGIFEASLPVYASLLIGFIAGFWIPSLISLVSWNNKWKLISSGELVVSEYLREKSFKNGLKFLFSPLTSPLVLHKRVEEYLKSWAFYALRERIKDDWVWEVYAASWPFIQTNQNAIKVLRQLLLNSDSIPEEAFSLALQIYRLPGENYELAQLIAHEGFKYDEEELSSLDSEALFHAWMSVYAVEDGEIKQKILPKILRKFLSTERRDHVAAKIYIDAYRSEKRSQPLLTEIKRTSEVLKRNNKFPFLAEELDKIYDSSGIVSPEDDSILEALLPKNEDSAEDSLKSDYDSSLEQPVVQKDMIEAKPSDVPEKKPEPSVLRVKEVVAETGHETEEVVEEVIEEKIDEENHISDTSGKLEVHETADIEEEIDQIDESVKETIPTKHLRFIGKKPSREFSIKEIFGKHKIAILGAGVSAIVLVTIIATIISFSGRWTDEYLSPPGDVMSDAPYTLQFHAATSAENALDRVKHFRSNNVDAYIVHATNSKWYKIRAGAFYEQEAARVYADSLKNSGLIEDYYIARFEKGYIPESAFK